MRHGSPFIAHTLAMTLFIANLWNHVFAVEAQHALVQHMQYH